MRAGSHLIALQWTYWPIRSRWPASLAVPAALGGVAFAMHLAYGSPLLDILAFVVLSLCLLRYLLPTCVEVDEQGISVRFCTRRRSYRWEQFESCRRVRGGLILRLRPPARRGRRQFFLPVPVNRDGVRKHVEKRIG